jgi:hypothetical protein
VVGDLLILAGTTLHLLPDAFHGAAPWIVLAATVLPAAVASLNGIRFQSEARRLAERSAFVRELLDGRRREAQDLRRALDAAQTSGAINYGSWNAQVLRLGEAVANDLVQEVAEWSVIYAKDLLEP